MTIEQYIIQSEWVRTMRRRMRAVVPPITRCLWGQNCLNYHRKWHITVGALIPTVLKTNATEQFVGITYFGVRWSKFSSTGSCTSRSELIWWGFEATILPHKNIHPHRWSTCSANPSKQGEGILYPFGKIILKDNTPSLEESWSVTTSTLVVVCVHIQELLLGMW